MITYSIFIKAKLNILSNKYLINLKQLTNYFETALLKTRIVYVALK